MKTSYKQLEEKRKHAKRVRDRNYRFKKMTPEAQRVRIAKDVIDQVKSKRLVAHAGLYLAVDNKAVNKKLTNLFDSAVSNTYSGSQPDQNARNTEYQPLLENVKCEVCGIGACFVAALDRADDLTVGEAAGDGRSYGNDSYMREYLKRWFSTDQLYLIEDAFEAYRRGRHDDGAHEFGNKFSNDNDRLIAIMQNIIDNNGTFTP